MRVDFEVTNDGKFGACTGFNYNEKAYYIILDLGDDGYEEFMENTTAVAIQQLKEKLLKYLNLDYIIFESQSNVYLNPDSNII